ncbi:MAG TPA: 16S rRNA (guanine(966)-N(2))-methyltransferase RsmD [Candidatus Saccharimonadales bacterium]|nr:16S rRNA (guanine(966)-N(2))-methyltransferase RsmD [Candidatus Saccharimonadales bacterium]
MRIIAGTLGGRLFAAPKGHVTHPMSDKVRGALFSMLGELDGLTVLDAFAGSGALAFEAVSRGAESATMIEQDRSAQTTITENIKKLDVAKSVKLIKSSASAWARTQPDRLFDVVLCDPPYDDLQLSTLTTLTQHTKVDGIFVLSWPGGEEPPEFVGLVRIVKKEYGDAQLAFYQKIL